MAEAVGLVVGVVSLGVQLAESIQKVKRFHGAVKDAPVRLASIIDEFESLSEILTEMEGKHVPDNNHLEPGLQRCIATCRTAVDHFSTYADSLEAQMKRHKRRGSIRFAMKSECVEGVISRLESSKSNLVLAYMLYREVVAEKRATKLQQQMEAIFTGQALLLQQTSCLPVTSKMPRSYLERRSDFRDKMKAQLSTPSWLSRTIWELAVRQATSGWLISVRNYQIVSIESSVVQACITGDVLALRQLFNSRAVSPYDQVGRESRVSSLLSMAVEQNQMEAAQLVIEASEGNIELDVRSMSLAWKGVRFVPFPDLVAARKHYNLLLDHCASDFHYSKLHSLSPTARDRLQIFVFGSVEEAKQALFWNDIINLSHYWKYFPTSNMEILSSGLGSMALTDEIICLLGSHAAKLQAQHVDLVAYALAQAFVASVLKGSDQSTNLARVLEKLIVEARIHGLDLHEPLYNGISLLLRLLHPATGYQQWQGPPKNAWLDSETSLKVWLTFLKRIGIDLASYGEEESRLFQQVRRSYVCERPWDCWHGDAVCPCFEPGSQRNDYYPTLFAFSYGAELSDWKLWVHHPGDNYAGLFWQMVERDGVSTEKEDYLERYVPGGWTETA